MWLCFTLKICHFVINERFGHSDPEVMKFISSETLKLSNVLFPKKQKNADLCGTDALPLTLESG